MGAAAMLAGGGAAAKVLPSEPDFASRYDVDRTFANLDAAYYGAMTRTTAEIYRRHGDWVNRHNALFLRSALPGPTRDQRLQPATDAVAGLIGAKPGEVALCAGGTEALYSLIVNYAPLEAGDRVVMADVDYDEMQFAMEHLRTTRGVEVVTIAIPEPSTTANILAAYARVLRERRPKLLLLTHVSNRAGLVMPVAEIARLAKAHGTEVILDSAQAVGLLPVDVDALGIDFMGFSLHKWVAAPLGTGGVYVRGSRLGDVRPWLGNRIHASDDVRARVPTGTVDFAARLTIPHAVAEHRALGPERKLAHLRSMRDRWIGAIRDVPGVEIVQTDERGRYEVIGAFRMPGQRTIEQARAAQRAFVERHRVLVVAKAGLASGPVLRVTPAPFNTPDEVDRLAAAVIAERRMFAA